MAQLSLGGQSQVGIFETGRPYFQAGKVHVVLASPSDQQGQVRGHGLEASGGSYGLTGMRERAELLGGTLTAAPTGRGFRVVLRVPA